MKPRICMISNAGPHYRYPIYSLMAKEFGCEFYLGDIVAGGIKKFDYPSLPGYKATLHNVFFHNFYWQHGAVELIAKPYDCYVAGGEPYCISTWLLLLLAKLRGKKTVCWSHGFYGREGKGKMIVKKTFFKLFSRMLIYNEYSIGIMERIGFKRSKMFCIANSLDSDKEKAIRQQLKPTDIYRQHFGNESPVAIYCGRIQRRKKLEQFIDALEILKHEGKRVNAVFVGKDSEGVNLEAYAKEKGVAEQVWMFGPCYDDNTLGELFYNAAVCVSPGNIGLTAIHSLTFGCPAITHDNFPYQMPEFEAIRPGLTGDFFKQDSTDDLAAKISKWASLSPQMREETRKAAYNEIDTKWNVHHQIDVMRNAFTF